MLRLLKGTLKRQKKIRLSVPSYVRVGLGESLLSMVSEGSENGSASDIKDLDQTCRISGHDQTSVGTNTSRVCNILEA